MKKFKVLSYGLLTLAVSIIASVSQAYQYQGYKRCGGFYAEIEPFYIKANDTLFSRSAYAALQPFPNIEIAQEPTITNRARFFNLDPDFWWGFRAAIGYDFPSCSCDSNYGFSLEYTHFNNDDDDSTPTFFDTDGFPDHVLFPLYSALINDRTGFEDNFSHASVRFETQYNTVDLLAHRNLYLCNCGYVQLFAGARFLNLQEKLNAHYSFVPSPDQSTLIRELQEDIHFKNRFNGIGPRLGSNVFYPFACGFGVTGEVAGSLLYGCTDSDYFDRHASIDREPIVPPGDVITIVENHKKHSARVIPALSAKVGLAYHAIFCNGSWFGVEIGYRGDKYFNVADNSALVESISIVPVFVDNDSGAIVRENFNQNSNYHDFDFAGPYLTVTYHM